MNLAPLYACVAHDHDGGEWNYLLWIDGCSWWAPAGWSWNG